MLNTLVLHPGARVPVQEQFKLNDFEDLNALVDGPFEMCSDMHINGHFYDIVMNEEGKFLNLDPSLALANKSTVYDVIAGKAYFLKSNELGQTIGLDEEDIKRITQYFEDSTKAYFLNVIAIPVLDSEGF